MIWFIFIYILTQVLIGILVSRRIKNETDFLVAGRAIPSFLLVFSLFATWFGAEAIVGTTGEVYKHGLAGSRADPFGYSICLLLLGLLIAGRIWRTEHLTLGDFFKNRFSSQTEKLAVLILFISSIIWAGAQIRAFGQILSHFSSLPLNMTMTIGFGLVVTYTLLGGLLGDILTDTLQGIVLIAGLIVLVFSVALNLETQDISKESLSPILSWTLAQESGLHRLERWSIPILGSLISQESITRILAARSARQAKSIAIWAGFVYLFVGCLPVTLGILGHFTSIHVIDHEQYIIKLAETYLSPIGQMIFLGALVSAILSTVDSILLSGGGLISHNFLIPKLKISTESYKLFLTRFCITFMASLAFFISLNGDGIYTLIELASSWGSAGILTITLMGLWTPLGNSYAAILTLVTGVILPPILEHGFHIETPFLVTLLFCFVTYLVSHSMSWTIKKLRQQDNTSDQFNSYF